MNLDQVLQTFLAESYELLQEMEDKLLGLETSDDYTESINSIFRAAHTIKGSAGLFSLDEIVEFTHLVESVLDDVRSGITVLDDDLVNVMLKAKDHIGKMVDSISDGQVELNQADLVSGTELAKLVSSYLKVAPPASEPNTDVTTLANKDADSIFVERAGLVENENWHISVHFGLDVFRNGMDPMSFFRYLNTFGHIEHVETITDRLPALKALDAESCYLGYEINFKTAATKETIENAFEFVKDDCQLHIVPPFAKVTDFIAIIDSLEHDDLKLGEILVKCGTLTARELDTILSRQIENNEAPRRFGELVVEDGLAMPEVVTAALIKQASSKKAKDKVPQTVRVEAEKLEHLINLIGELVIASAGVEAEAGITESTNLVESTQTLSRLVEEVRESALNLRMVQIGETFNRYQRVVRDISKELGKAIDLQIFGAETELDKTVIEKISDPLMHLVRNSIDHGIESPELRAKRGKAEIGIVTLNAFHESGSIVIEVSDDGGGLNRDRILEKAKEKGLVAPDAELTDRDIYQLIFEAGFSTADSISNISGRGVGMDVVRRNIEALRGTIDIDSQIEKGTKIQIRLPLTLAIIDGFLMKVGNGFYVIPLDIVDECIELKGSDVTQQKVNNYISLRGQILPFIRLREHFKTAVSNTKRENVVVVRYGSLKAGFVVDELMGELQTVIKPLGPLFDKLSGISGSTILGSGEVALILDAPSLINMAVQQDTYSVNKVI